MRGHRNAGYVVGQDRAQRHTRENRESGDDHSLRDEAARTHFNPKTFDLKFFLLLIISNLKLLHHAGPWLRDRRNLNPFLPVSRLGENPAATAKPARVSRPRSTLFL